MTDAPFRSALDLAAAIRARQVGARELLDLYVDRIGRLDPRINAVVVRDEEAARAQADAADAALAKGTLRGPLHGVPMTVKESFDLAGHPTTWGLPDYREHRAAEDALAVQRLKAAGAVVFGKTNVPVLLADWQSYNPIYGCTNNPWDVTRSPGGSSGGSAAALAAGLTALEMGSDIGASIRNPAHYCGVYGHKPTWGICPPRGHGLDGALTVADIAVIGPLSRSAGDLRVALEAMAGPDEIEAGAWTLTLSAARRQRLKDWRVAVMLDDRNGRGGPERAGRDPAPGGFPRRAGCGGQPGGAAGGGYRSGAGRLHPPAARRDLRTHPARGLRGMAAPGARPAARGRELPRPHGPREHDAPQGLARRAGTPPAHAPRLGRLLPGVGPAPLPGGRFRGGPARPRGRALGSAASP
jgi:hypothetical protein